MVEQTKFLGLIFDRKLSFVPHPQYLRHKCLKALHLLRVVANTKWDSDEKALLLLYCSLIRSKLEYGAVMYGSARKSYLRMLEPIQSQALRTCLGAFWTSPVTSLHVEANEMPLESRSETQNIHNPVRSCIFIPQFTKFFDKNPNNIRPHGLRVSGDLSDIGFSQKIICYFYTFYSSMASCFS